MFSVIAAVSEGDTVVSESEASGCRELTGFFVVLIEISFSVLCWELCTVETFESGRFTVPFVVMSSFFMTPSTVAPSPLTVVVKKGVVSGNVCEAFVLIASLRDDVSAVDVITRFGDGVGFGVGTNVCVVDIDDDDTGVVIFLASWLSSLLLQRLGRRQRMVT